MEIRCLARCVFYDSHGCPRATVSTNCLNYYCTAPEDARRGEIIDRVNDRMEKRGVEIAWKEKKEKEGKNSRKL